MRSNILVIGFLTLTIVTCKAQLRPDTAISIVDSEIEDALESTAEQYSEENDNEVFGLPDQLRSNRTFQLRTRFAEQLQQAKGFSDDR